MSAFAKYISQVRRNGKIAYRFCMGAIEAEARTKAEVIEKAMTELERHSRRPSVGLIRCGEEIRVLCEWGGDCETLKPVEDQSDGQLMLFSASFGQGDIFERIESELHHIAQIMWDGEDQIPEWLPSSKVDDFKHWVNFQLAYRSAKESGLSPQDCHRFACRSIGAYAE